MSRMVHEEFLGLYEVPTIEAATLFDAIKDVFTRLNLPSVKLHGQCYDTASAMNSSKRGISKLVSDLESRAVYMHCYGHALNLAAGDTLTYQCSIF